MITPVFLKCAPSDTLWWSQNWPTDWRTVYWVLCIIKISSNYHWAISVNDSLTIIAISILLPYCLTSICDRESTSIENLVTTHCSVRGVEMSAPPQTGRAPEVRAAQERRSRCWWPHPGPISSEVTSSQWLACWDFDGEMVSLGFLGWLTLVSPREAQLVDGNWWKSPATRSTVVKLAAAGIGNPNWGTYVDLSWHVPGLMVMVVIHHNHRGRGATQLLKV